IRDPVEATKIVFRKVEPVHAAAALDQQVVHGTADATGVSRDDRRFSFEPGQRQAHRRACRGLSDAQPRGPSSTSSSIVRSRQVSVKYGTSETSVMLDPVTGSVQ